ncbi:MAG TPA: ethanolamine ammonia-lyase subunit EutC [Candidatus Acidoferrales bacterium]|nr:ethanolamine ammonia-lyase subunit EutC [Candidatus Acidoferrales bacterium]
MAEEKQTSLTAADLPELVRKIRARTPARILAGRSGAAYRTETQLELREAHAAARDAVRAELDLESAFGSAFVAQWRLFEVATEARSKEEFLLEPGRGRRFAQTARQELSNRCPPGTDVQIAIGDGLSVTAVAAQVPALLPLLAEGARQRGWTVGQPFVIRHCRVGVLNEIGELLFPKVAVLLIGERPGLATAESLSAYMAYQPRKGHTDADRNLVSNIHARGLGAQAAAAKILDLAGRMMAQGAGGLAVRDEPRLP